MEDFADMTDVPRKSDSSRGQLDTVAAALWAVTRDIRAASRAIPGVSLIEAQATAGERFFLRQIKAVLDQIDPPPTARAASPAEPAGPAASATAAALDGRPPTIDDRMRALLTRSLHTTPAESRRALHELLVSELVPDEARILSALSDGSTYPLVHIAEPGVGNTQQRVLENASSVGRAAGVALPDRVHVYASPPARARRIRSRGSFAPGRVRHPAHRAQDQSDDRIDPEGPARGANRPPDGANVGSGARALGGGSDATGRRRASTRPAGQLTRTASRLDNSGHARPESPAAG
jgi:hypothetical protein